MKSVVIWGTGKYASYIFKDILMDKCVFEGFVDNNIEKQNKLWENQYRIYSLEKSIELNIDYYLISAMYYKEQILSQARSLGIENKLIWYWKDDLSQYEFFNNCSYLKENILLKLEIEKLQRQVDNAPYEYGEPPVKIKSAKELLQKIIDKKYSLCRFGDGEFDHILKQNREWFQKYDIKMAEKLESILKSDNDKILIAIADNYGSLDKYNDRAADVIRQYMTKEKRQEHMGLLDMSREYYNAYVSRPYMIYKDKDKNASEIFKLYKRLFWNRNILIIEGENTKTGVNNGLLDGAYSIKRILCPDTNAYSVYDKILNNAIEFASPNDLILITLGPTATILAYDLAMQGYQAIDFGQVDNEYEWYLRHATERIVIEGKSVSELAWYRIPETQIYDDKYKAQIIAHVK